MSGFLFLVISLFFVLSNCTYEWRILSGVRVDDRSFSSETDGVYDTQGSYTEDNYPGSRESFATWKINDDEFMLWGGVYVENSDSEYYQDTWVYNSTLNQWKYYGPTTRNGVESYCDSYTNGCVPIGKEGVAAWKVSDTEYQVFGGRNAANVQTGGTTDSYSDIWVYSTVQNSWHFVNGPKTVNLDSNCGTTGVYEGAIYPGARDSVAVFEISTGEKVIFGGRRALSAGDLRSYNDVWYYHPTNDQWKYMGPFSGSNDAGYYVSKGSFSADGYPGSRYGTYHWLGANDVMYIFGGNGIKTSGSPVSYNDLWAYQHSSGQWKWIKGDNTGNNDASLVSKGEFAASNNPDGRNFGFTGASDDYVLLFGGGTYSSTRNNGWLLNQGTEEYTLITGEETFLSNGIYKSNGEFHIDALPYPIYRQGGWKISENNYLMFGGNIAAVSSNELWQITDLKRCAGVSEYDESVCSGRGYCIADNQCHCTTESFRGDNCEDAKCQGYWGAEGCNFNGECYDLDICECNSTHDGRFCQYPICGGYNSEDVRTCGGHGTCVGYETCQCDSGYFGENCAGNSIGAAVVTVLSISAIIFVLCVVGIIAIIIIVIVLRIRASYKLVDNKNYSMVKEGGASIKDVQERDNEIKKLEKKVKKQEKKEEKRIKELQELRKTITQQQNQIGKLHQVIRESQQQLTNLNAFKEFVQENYDEVDVEGGEQQQTTPAPVEEGEVQEMTEFPPEAFDLTEPEKQGSDSDDDDITEKKAPARRESLSPEAFKDTKI